MPKSKDPNDYDWECMYNHTPQWMRDLENELDACMRTYDDKQTEGQSTYSKLINILDEYNELTEKEEDFKNEDAFSIYGIEDRKAELVQEFIKIHEPFRKEAEELKAMKLLEDDE